MKTGLSGLLIALTFLVLATANSGGYRFGVSDQAFYVPAVFRHLEPGTFPRDRGLIQSQARLLVLDEIAAGTARGLGVSVESVFAAAFLVGGCVLGASLWRLAAAIGMGTWASIGFLAAMTLRHRITATGVNTFEGYFHPRILAFGLGIAALVCTLSRRPISTVAFVAAALSIHPTTGLWFAGWLAVAWMLVGQDTYGFKRMVPLWAAAVCLAAGVFVFLLLEGERMGPSWTALLASKDYVFPTSQWSAKVWGLQTAIVVLAAGLYVVRRRTGLASDAERAALFGLMALVAAFLLSLLLSASHVALAVQLQTSRVLWPVEVMATLYLTWWLCEGSFKGTKDQAHRVPSRRAPLVVGVLMVASVSRGAYIMGHEVNDRSLVRIGLARNEWTAGLLWLREHTPTDAHILADPAHAWRYGTSVRIGARRDVYFEEVKDVAMALYARDTAERALARIEALGGFEHLDAPRLEALSRRFELDYLIGERTLGTTLGLREDVWHNERYAVWQLNR